MTISELICRLQAIKCEHGDLPVAFPDECGVWVGVSSVDVSGGETVLGNMSELAVIK